MRDSGDVLDLSGIKGVKVDKAQHRRRGRQDLTGADTDHCCARGSGCENVRVGSGHTGGTIDKLECFDGFTTALEERFAGNVNTIGIAIAGTDRQSGSGGQEIIRAARCDGNGGSDVAHCQLHHEQKLRPEAMPSF